MFPSSYRNTNIICDLLWEEEMTYVSTSSGGFPHAVASFTLPDNYNDYEYFIIRWVDANSGSRHAIDKAPQYILKLSELSGITNDKYFTYYKTSSNPYRVAKFHFVTDVAGKDALVFDCSYSAAVSPGTIYHLGYFEVYGLKS